MTTPWSTSSFFGLFPLYVLLKRSYLSVRGLNGDLDEMEDCREQARHASQVLFRVKKNI